MSKFAFLLPGPRAVLIALLACAALPVHAQVNHPSKRDVVLAEAQALLATRSAELPSDKTSLDPFIGNIARGVDKPVEEVVEVRSSVNEADLLKALADRVNARGTAIMGEDKFLLLGQKRLKVGSVFTISFEGQDYELMLLDVTSTTFTVQRKGLSLTRPVKVFR